MHSESHSSPSLLQISKKKMFETPSKPHLSCLRGEKQSILNPIGLQIPVFHRIGLDFWWSCWIGSGSSWRLRGLWDPAHASAKMRSSHGNLATKACRIGEHFHFLQFPGLKSSTLPQEVILSAIMASSGLPTLHWLRWYAAELDMLTGRCPEWAIAYVFRLAILILCH